MKFGRTFHQHQVPEWASSYLNYRGLKRLSQVASKCAAERGHGGDFTDLFAALGRELDHVDTFYTHQYALLLRKATVLPPNFADSLDWHDVDRTELHFLLATFVELRHGLQKLQWHGKVNNDGFRLILRKLDKLRSEACRRDPLDDVESKLSNAQFASQAPCLKELERINRLIDHLTRAMSQSHASSKRRSLLLDRVCAQLCPSFNSSTTTAHHAIRQDDASALDRLVQDQASKARGLDPSFQPLLLILLQCSILYGSKPCIDTLLSRVGSLPEEKFNLKGCIHLLLIQTGREKMLSGLQGQPTCRQDSIDSIGSNGVSRPLLNHVLDQLSHSQQQSSLDERDSFGRLPLHYAAGYGLVDACQVILTRMQGAGLAHVPTASGAVLLQDSEGYNPLHLAVIGGHTAATKTLLDFYNLNNSADQMVDLPNLDAVLGGLLAIALKSHSVEIVQLLVATNVNIDYQGTCGETALYIAARSGREDFVKLLLNRGADVNAVETVCGWTPLFIACVQGHLSIVEHLLQAGASQETRDPSGWTARDHAAYRGHIKVAERLRASDAGNSASIPSSVPGRAGSMVPALRPTSSIQPGEGVDMSASDLPGTSVRHPPISECRVIVNLCSFDTYKDVTAVDLSPYLSRNGHPMHPESGFSVQVSAIGASGTNNAVQLPILEDMTNRPWLFSTKDPSGVKLVFNISREITDADGRDRIAPVGSGIALLESLKHGLGSNRESLIRDYSIPILEKDTLKFIGTVTFSFVIVTPFSHPEITPPAADALWSEHGPTKVVGHRGLGQNVAPHKRLQLGENTIQSFLTAIDLGASYVELDVQLTKDHVPVVYHDFIVSETGTDLPLHNLSLEQFMHISEAQSPPPQGDLPSAAKTRRLEGSNVRRTRSFSSNASDHSRAHDFNQRMKRTFKFKLRGFKGNTRGDYIHDSFITLKELLEKVPESIPFNIEIKYPMPFEAVDGWKMDLYAIELNLFVDTILSHIFHQPSNRARPMMLTSFSPEVCILLSLKQSCYPVLFLNDSGNHPTGDVRASSVQEAVHFAKRWNLDGIVAASEPFVLAPKLVRLVRDRGLVCASYGVLNNDPKLAKIQADAGLSVIIVDEVRLISQALGETCACPQQTPVGVSESSVQCGT